jgi:hypothetical protein
MASKRDTKTHHTATTDVTVRIPDGAEADLTTEAARRLTRTTGVQSVTVNGVRDISPGLSATAVTVRVTVETTGKTVAEALAGATFVRVEGST